VKREFFVNADERNAKFYFSNGCYDFSLAIDFISQWSIKNFIQQKKSIKSESLKVFVGMSLKECCCISYINFSYTTSRKLFSLSWVLFLLRGKKFFRFYLPSIDIFMVAITQEIMSGCACF
jgi:hypothetical protein